MTKIKTISVLVALGLLPACAPQSHAQNNPALQTVAAQAIQSFSCKDADRETQLWDGLKSYLIEQKALPSAMEMTAALQLQVQSLAQTSGALNAQDIAIITQSWQALVQTLLDEASRGEKVETPQQLLMLLSAIDVGDRTTPFRSYLQDKVTTEFAQLKQVMAKYDLPCTAEKEKFAAKVETTASDADYESLKQQALNAGVPLSSFGDRWVFATTYQSCQSEQLPAMTTQTPIAEGIKIVGTAPDGVGKRRIISSLPELQKTDYYIKQEIRKADGCYDVSQKPLIYNYGGKPYATTAADSTLDLFTPNGNGQPGVLGIDCSGYVFSSMAAAGLRLKVGRALKASDALAWGSTAYLEPQKNGLTCLDKITVTPTDSLHAGDIVAVNGHVLLIDKAGTDPLGVEKAGKQSDCAKLSSDDFDFVIAQSSNSKNGIGINYFEAKDFLPTDSEMKTGLQKYAYYACLARFQGKSSTPSLGTLSVVRHKGTAECLAPRVKLAHESCIQSCSTLLR